MKRAIGFNKLAKKSGTLKRGNIELAISKDIGKVHEGVKFYSSVDPGDGIVFISDSENAGKSTSTTATPIFYRSLTKNPSDVLATINGLPERRNQPKFTDINVALNWVASTGKYFTLSKFAGDIPGTNIVLYLDAQQYASYPGTGNVWYDLSGNNLHANLYNGPTWNSLGYWYLDGSNDYFEIPYASVMNNWSSEQTILVWINHNYTSGRRNIWDQAYGGYGTWTHEQGGGISQYFGDGAGNTSPYVGIGSSAPDRDRWNCMAITRNTSQHKWFKNGVRTNTYNHSYGTLTNHNTRVRIGNGYAGYWTGNLAKVIAYDRALSEAEVKQAYYETRPIVRNGLVLNLEAANPLSYTGGKNWFDRSGRDYNFALQGNATYTTGYNGVPCISFPGGYNDYTCATYNGTIKDDIGQACTLQIIYSSNGGSDFGSCARLFSVSSDSTSNIDYYQYFALASCDQTKHGLWIANNPQGLYPASAIKEASDKWSVVTYRWTAGGQASIFVNGVLQSSSSRGARFDHNEVRRMTIAMNSNYQIEHSNVKVASVLMYNRALTDTEIQHNFNTFQLDLGI